MSNCHIFTCGSEFAMHFKDMRRILPLSIHMYIEALIQYIHMYNEIKWKCKYILLYKYNFYVYMYTWQVHTIHTLLTHKHALIHSYLLTNLHTYNQNILFFNFFYEAYMYTCITHPIPLNLYLKTSNPH